MNAKEIAAGAAQTIETNSDGNLAYKTAIILAAIEKARGIKTTEYAKGWDDHVAAVRAAHASEWQWNPDKQDWEKQPAHASESIAEKAEREGWEKPSGSIGQRISPDKPALTRQAVLKMIDQLVTRKEVIEAAEKIASLDITAPRIHVIESIIQSAIEKAYQAGYDEGKEVEKQIHIETERINKIQSRTARASDGLLKKADDLMREAWDLYIDKNNVPEEYAKAYSDLLFELDQKTHEPAHASEPRHCPACNGDELAKIGEEWVECPGIPPSHAKELERSRDAWRSVAHDMTRKLSESRAAHGK